MFLRKSSFNTPKLWIPLHIEIITCVITKQLKFSTARFQALPILISTSHFLVCPTCACTWNLNARPMHVLMINSWSINVKRRFRTYRQATAPCPQELFQRGRRGGKELWTKYTKVKLTLAQKDPTIIFYFRQMWLSKFRQMFRTNVSRIVSSKIFKVHVFCPTTPLGQAPMTTSYCLNQRSCKVEIMFLWWKWHNSKKSLNPVSLDEIFDFLSV